YPVAHRVRGGNQSRLARGVAVQERGTRDRFGRFCAQSRAPGARGYVSGAAAFRGVLPEDAKGFADGSALVAVPFVRVGKSGRVPGGEFARALSRGDGVGRELYAVSRYAQRHAAPRRDSDVSFARLRREEGTNSRVDGCEDRRPAQVTAPQKFRHPERSRGTPWHVENNSAGSFDSASLRSG